VDLFVYIVKEFFAILDKAEVETQRLLPNDSER
jgi:hypothetical protein